MSEPMQAIGQVEEAAEEERWTGWLVLFLRIAAAVSLLKGLYHWSQVLGIGVNPNAGFDASTTAWQAATIYFAVIDLVAAVGLWLVAAWGGVVWLTAAISMAAVELFFPQVYGGRLWVVAIELVAIGAYFTLMIAASREQPE